MRRSAVAYISNGRFLLAPVIRTSADLELEIDPVRINDPHDASAIREALIVAFESSGRVIPHPAQDQWKWFFRAFQDAAGVRSLKAFMNGAKCINIDVGDNHIRVTPTKNLGSTVGFEEMPDAAIILPADDVDGAVSALQSLLFANVS